MSKITMKTPIVEMDGDEMTRIIWQQIKNILLLPYVDLKTEYFDLGLENRDLTDDQVTIDAARRTRELGVAVKCATITPNAQRVDEYKLKKMWKSPNGTIRAILDGTVFRAPILVSCIKPFVSCWEKPITLARHAYGDIYRNSEMLIVEPCKAELLLTLPDGTTQRQLIHEFTGRGILMGMHNTDQSIYSFARSCFNYALDLKQDLWFATKDTISKVYDHRFKDIFAEVFMTEFKEKFKATGIEYFYTLIDDAVARIMRSEGGILWACKNYDGDVMSDMVASACGSLAMMTSVLVSPDGKYEYEAAHGTVTRHYYRYLKGEQTSSNPMATLFAWTGALRKRAELDGQDDLAVFSAQVERAAIETIEAGIVTGDLKNLVKLPHVTVVDTDDFLKAIATRLEMADKTKQHKRSQKIMSYYTQWQAVLSAGGSSPEADDAIKKYYDLETEAYEKILLEKQATFDGTAAQLAEKLGFGSEMVTFTGFIDGINSSLANPIDLENLQDDTVLTLAIDFRKLYLQMHAAKADWLYNLKAWQGILTLDEQKELTREYRTSKIVRHEKIGRNDPCPCGSGKKYKICCGKGD